MLHFVCESIYSVCEYISQATHALVCKLQTEIK